MEEASKSYSLSSDGEPYKSCIKINGVPILPPLMTPEYREEMQYYKHLAVAVERRIQDLKLCLDETTINTVLPSDSEEWCDSVNSLKAYNESDCGRIGYFSNNQIDILDGNEFESINSLVTVIDRSLNSNEHSQYNNIKYSNFSNEDNLIVERPTDVAKSDPRESDLMSFSEVFVKNTNQRVSKDNLTPDSKSKNQSNNKNSNKGKNLTNSEEKPKKQKINSVLKTNISIIKNVSKNSQNSNNNSKHKRFPSSEKENRSNSKASLSSSKKSIINQFNANVRKAKSSDKKNKHLLSPSKNVTGSLNNISSEFESPHKLVRQNSYTLEYPSALLLAHLEERSLASGVDLRSISMSESTSTSIFDSSTKQRSWESNTAKETWSSIGSDINSLSVNENFDNSNQRELRDMKNIQLSHFLTTASEQSKFESSSLSEKDCSIFSESLSKVDLEIGSEYTTSENTSPKSSPNKNCNEQLKMFSIEGSILEKISQKRKESIEEDIKDNLTNISKNTSKSDGVDDIDDILKKIQNDHEKKLSDLITKQKEEQMLLKKAFDEQQKYLLDQYKALCKNESAKSNICDFDTIVISDKKVNSEANEIYLIQPPISTNAFSDSLSKPKSTQRSSGDILLNLSSNVDSSNSKVLYCASDANRPKAAKNSELISMTNFSSKDLVDVSYNEDLLMTNRTNNTLDDVNSTLFTSEDIVSEIEAKPLSTTPPKLKTALDKLTKIQKSLASETNYRDLPRHYLEDGAKMISLSSIRIEEPNFVAHSCTDRSTLSLNLINVNRPTEKNENRSIDIIPMIMKKYQEQEIHAATIIVAYSKGYLTRRLMRTEKVQSTVQTIRDALMCALQLHRDEGGIRGADVDLHRRLIQQITAACYALHDMFIIYTPLERMSIISQDRERKISLSQRSSNSGTSLKQLSATTQRVLKRKIERMSKSHIGVFNRPTRSQNSISSSMTRSHYEPNCNIKMGISDKPRRSVAVTGDFSSRKPWR